MSLSDVYSLGEEILPHLELGGTSLATEVPQEVLAVRNIGQVETNVLHVLVDDNNGKFLVRAVLSGIDAEHALVHQRHVDLRTLVTEESPKSIVGVIVERSAKLNRRQKTYPR